MLCSRPQAGRRTAGPGKVLAMQQFAGNLDARRARFGLVLSRFNSRVPANLPPGPPDRLSRHAPAHAPRRPGTPRWSSREPAPRSAPRRTLERSRTAARSSLRAGLRRRGPSVADARALREPLREQGAAPRPGLAVGGFHRLVSGHRENIPDPLSDRVLVLHHHDASLPAHQQGPLRQRGSALSIARSVPRTPSPLCLLYHSRPTGARKR